MKFAYKTKGRRPRNGYPVFLCLHGGGGCPAPTNDSQYNIMKSYWAGKCLDVGVYVACRGVTDSWKLHWEDQSFACYDRIVANCLTLLEGDPDRVYVMGYSAGGDGVYRVPPVLCDVFAAANMCAGHPNGVGLSNFMHVPLLLQVGELDTAYKRHSVTAEQGAALRGMRAAALREAAKAGVGPDGAGPFCPAPCGGACARDVAGQLAQCAGPAAKTTAGPYLSEVRVHCGKPHSGIGDWGRSCAVVANPEAWLRSGCARGGGGQRTIRSDSVGWCAQFVRNPAPRFLRWAPNVPSRGTAGRHLYHFWLDISRGEWPYDSDSVQADIGRSGAQTTITVRRCGSDLTLLVNRDVLGSGCSRLRVVVCCPGVPNAEWLLEGTVGDVGVARRTLAAREDPRFVYNAEVHLRQRGRAWDLFAAGFSLVTGPGGAARRVPRPVPTTNKVVLDFSRPAGGPAVTFRAGDNNMIASVVLPPNAVRSEGELGPWAGLCTLRGSVHRPDHDKLYEEDCWYRISTSRATQGFTWGARYVPKRPGDYVLVLVAKGASTNFRSPLSRILCHVR
jgi:hypothetical protein